MNYKMLIYNKDYKIVKWTVKLPLSLNKNITNKFYSNIRIKLIIN